jgi:hypothetical protein
VVALILRATRIALPKSLSDKDKDEIQKSIGITLFLGCLAFAGIVLRGENKISEFVANSAPVGAKVSLIDPTFALVCIIGIWLLAAYRIRKR